MPGWGCLQKLKPSTGLPGRTYTRWHGVALQSHDLRYRASHVRGEDHRRMSTGQTDHHNLAAFRKQISGDLPAVPISGYVQSHLSEPLAAPGTSIFCDHSSNKITYVLVKGQPGSTGHDHISNSYSWSANNISLVPILISINKDEIPWINHRSTIINCHQLLNEHQSRWNKHPLTTN